MWFSIGQLFGGVISVPAGLGNTIPYDGTSDGLLYINFP